MSRDLEPPPSDVDPQSQIGQSFKRAIAAMRRLRGREKHRPGELSDAQYGLLFGLRGHGERSLTELAFEADLAPGSAAEMLDSLAAAGLVRRVRSDRDRRIVLSSLTDRGRLLVEEHRREVEPRWRAALAEFSDEQLLTAAAVLERVRMLFDELAEERTKAAVASEDDQVVEQLKHA